MLDFIADPASGDDSWRRGAGGRRDPRLADFAQRGFCDGARPSAWMGMVISDLSRPDRRCDDATDEEVFGLLRGWKSMEAWTAAGKLGVVRELIRRRPHPDNGELASESGLPWEWDDGLEHEVSAALGISLVAAGKLIRLAWSLEARVPRVGQALDEGRLDYSRAKLIADETEVLSDFEKLSAAERMILARLARCKTWMDLLRLIQQAVCAVDPEGARKRREKAEREHARVQFWRESSGACAMAGRELPADEALAAYAHVEQRAQDYRKAGVKRYIDILRVMAYLDILNGVPAADRIARVKAEDAAEEGAKAAEAAPTAGTCGARPGAHSRPGKASAAGPSDGHAPDDPVSGDRTPDHDAPDHDAANCDAADHGSQHHGSQHHDRSGDGDSPGHGDTQGGDGPADEPGRAIMARVNLTLPLVTQMGLAERPGEAHGLGALDPALVRQLAEAAARSSRSEFCVTIVDDQGHAIGHGCCKPVKGRRGSARGKAPPGSALPGSAPPAPPHGPPEAASRATLTPSGKPGPPGGYGSWILTLPGASHAFTVDIDVVPVYSCDHRHESAGHDPSGKLRHLVQVRDGNCTFPTCSRHARESDFEHAIPHDQGGRTCGCNAGARSRSCHQVKQKPGWNVTQPAPGWHQWTTPSGRAYTQGPWEYPA